MKRKNITNKDIVEKLDHMLFLIKEINRTNAKRIQEHQKWEVTMMIMKKQISGLEKLPKN